MKKTDLICEDFGLDNGLVKKQDMKRLIYRK